MLMKVKIFTKPRSYAALFTPNSISNYSRALGEQASRLGTPPDLRAV